MDKKQIDSCAVKAKVPSGQRVKVLVVLHDDGFVEVFGRDDVDVKVVNLPSLPVRGEAKAEEWLDLTLPKPYKDVHWPGMSRATGFVQKVTAFDLAHQQRTLDLIRYCDHLLREGEVVEL